MPTPRTDKQLEDERKRLHAQAERLMIAMLYNEWISRPRPQPPDSEPEKPSARVRAAVAGQCAL